MLALPLWAVSLCGGIIGFAVGYAARRGRLCTFGALEDAFIGRDFRRLKVLAIALAIALLAVQTLIVSGAMLPAAIRQLSLTLPWFSLALGALIFGFGMALVGTCAFGCLVRLGGGDLRSLVAIGVYAIAALAIMRGGLVPYYVYLDSISVPMPGGGQADIAALLSWFAGVNLRIPLALVCAAALLAWAFSRRDLFRTPRLIISGLTLGLGVALAWLVTGVLADDMMAVKVPTQGLSFVSPVAAAFQAIALQSDATWSFGIATVVGTVIGSVMASAFHDEFRWEAFDDAHEMKRHLFGAALMGFGGVMAGGCTIGQGVTAGSALALSWPVTIGFMALGARFGLYYTMEALTLSDLMAFFRRRRALSPPGSRVPS